MLPQNKRIIIHLQSRLFSNSSEWEIQQREVNNGSNNVANPVIADHIRKNISN